MTVGKTIALTTGIFVNKVMSLHLNTLPRFFIAFLPRSKCLLFLCLQSPSTLILEPKKVRSVTVSTFSPSICHEVMGSDGTGCSDLIWLQLQAHIWSVLGISSVPGRKRFSRTHQTEARSSPGTVYYTLTYFASSSGTELPRASDLPSSGPRRGSDSTQNFLSILSPTWGL